MGEGVKVGAYYNEHDPFAAAWLRELIKAGLIAPGDVDERDIQQVQPHELSGYTQCHFFAGIGGWSYALRLAGWPDDQPVWTGSCPCQPFSSAGRRGAERDERHLWPDFHRLIADSRPPVCFGEQVASADGRAWLAGVRADLDRLGYAVGAADLCAAGVGAPHIRQRVFWVADATGGRHEERISERVGSSTSYSQGEESEARGLAQSAVDRRAVGGMGDSDEPGPQGREQRRDGTSERITGPSGVGSCGMGDTEAKRLQDRRERSEPINPWSSYELVPCRDGKARRVEPGPQQMADGFSEVLGLLRPGAAAKIQEELSDAAITEADAREALRNLWIDLATWSVQRTTGRLRSVHEAPVLLAVLRELSREGWHLLDHLPPACWETPEAGLRELRKAASKAARTPQRREPREQRGGEPQDALSVLSQAVARSGDLMIPFPLARDVPARVGRLRGYGNAIVPQVAAEFVRAWMECRP